MGPDRGKGKVICPDLRFCKLSTGDIQIGI